MSLKQYIKRIIKYIVYGQLEHKVYSQIVCLSPNELLKGRVALITGGTSGIGYEIAKAFINAGAKCIITGRNEIKINEACISINNEVVNKNKIWGLQMDVTETEFLKEKFTKAMSLVNDKIDILVNNAGIVGGEIKNCTEEQFNEIFNTNLRGPFFLSQIFARYLSENKIRGNILNIGSSSSLRPATSAYTITKNGIYGFTRGLAKILAPYDITVNGIAPGPTATPMLMKNGIKENIKFNNPLGRYILPEEIANMAVFLVGETGRAIIGDMIFMTGGSGVVTYDDVTYSF